MFAFNFFESCIKWPPIFQETSPEFLDLHNKADPDDYNVAKFHGDRLRELGYPVAKL